MVIRVKLWPADYNKSLMAQTHVGMDGAGIGHYIINASRMEIMEEDEFWEKVFRNERGQCHICSDDQHHNCDNLRADCPCPCHNHYIYDVITQAWRKEYE